MKQQIDARGRSRIPHLFRASLRLPDVDAAFEDLQQSWQADDFAALDPAWQSLAHVPLVSRSEPVCRRAYLERPRGHSKTSDTAMQLAWILLHARRPVRGLAAAADRDQASLITSALKDLADANPEFCSGLVFRKHLVTNPETGSMLEIISSDVGSSYGLLPDFVICDELCHWEHPELWHSLLSSAAKKQRCVLVVLTNAGVGRGWQWDVRSRAEASPDWYFHSLDGVRAPWLDAAALSEQQQLLPPAVYDRLWNNRWQHSDGEFITLAEAEACRDATLEFRSHAQPHTHYVAAIDYAEKHDLSVGVLLHQEHGRIVVDRMDVAAPSPTSPTPVAWVDEWLTGIARHFPSTTFVLDPYQLVGLLQKYEGVLDVRRFEFAGGVGNHNLALTLRRLIANRGIAWPAGCGQRPDRDVRDDLETELASLRLLQRTSGRVRIDHRNSFDEHDDRAFALGAAALHVTQHASGGEWMTCDGML